MTVAQAVAYIENFTWSTSKMGLERTQELLSKMGNPQKALKFVHITGSNGKGSTCAMVASVLTAAGYRTGMYTSPHVCDFNERMQINGTYISDEALTDITEYVAGIADAMEDHPSQFELVTAIAMEYFYREHCDIVILEVGMGGALDSTNVIDAPLVAAFTNIGLEHTEYLGNTIGEIARTKAGIIKPGCQVVCYDSNSEAVDTIRSICKDLDVPFILAEDAAEQVSASMDGQVFRYKGKQYEIRLLGKHQLRNAVVALEILKVLSGHGFPISDEQLQRGLKQTFWPARFEVLHREPPFILDGGHNPQCAMALIKTLEEVLPGQKVFFLTGVLADKDYEQIVDLIAPYAAGCVCVTPDNPRALSASDYAEVFRKRGIEALPAESIGEGVNRVRSKAQGSPVVAFGSLYMAGEIRKMMCEKEGCR